jgi:hypothetical protein
MSLERERLLDRATSNAAASSRDDRRTRAVRLIATASCVGVATYALARASGMMFAPSLGNTQRDSRFGASSIDATERTVREYKDELSILSWSHDRGFETHRGSWRQEARSADANETPDAPAKDERDVSNRQRGAATLMAQTIAKYMPGRLSETSAPFELLYSTWDMPSTPCLDAEYAQKLCEFDRWVPIFNFGSSFKDQTVLPTMVPATLGALRSCFIEGLNPHLGFSADDEPQCDFLRFPTTKYSEQGKCDAKLAQCRYHGLFSLNAVDDKSMYEWDNLKPQVEWRGSDYSFLAPRVPGHKPDANEFLSEIASSANVSQALHDMAFSTDIGPRLRAVLFSKLYPELIDAKFFNWKNQSSERDKMAAELGIDATERLTEEALGKYKYHLDLGGGGGTTWSGLIPKLTMPGVLLHHETSMKDSYFDTLKPWVHYVPVAEDLHDVFEKISWCETHPEEARNISANANDWVRDFRGLKSLLRHNYQALAIPLAKTLDPSGETLLDFEAAHVAARAERLAARAAKLAIKASRDAAKAAKATNVSD